MSHLQTAILHLYARLERPLLLLNYRLVTRQWIRRQPWRWLMGRLFLRLLTQVGAVGQPLTLDEARSLVRQAASAGCVAIGPCGCRSVHGGCTHPVMTDVLIYEGVSVWQAAFPDQYFPATVEDVNSVLSRCRQLGMAQVLYRTGMGEGRGYCICNCCSDGCIPLLNRRLYPPYRFRAGEFVAYVDSGICTSCGACIERCPFDARAAGDDGRVAGCLGCGLCSHHCQAGAVTMQRRQEKPLGREK
jgi:NAD-dependent dihydropyrimidine dehydrogenase PreA subunit